MGTAAFGKALEAMVNDGDATSTFAEGDFGALAEQDLTPAERALLQAAALEMPDVSGFSNFFLKLDYIGETEKNIRNLDAIKDEFGPRFSEAVEYYRFEGND